MKMTVFNKILIIITYDSVLLHLSGTMPFESDKRV